MDNFNLIDSPWIPVRWLDGASPEKPPRVSLAEAFSRSREIADLDCAPHERIALTRLLVCITHAALGAPEDPDSWDGFGENLETAVPEYLRQPQIYPHFNLLGDGPRFLQRKADPEIGISEYPICKMFFSMAAGNSPTLFDHWGQHTRSWQPAEIAVGILCLQNFFIGGSMASKVKGNGPSLKYIQLFVRGTDLRENILRNSLDLETIRLTGAKLGRPTWEVTPTNDLLSRLSPVSCNLWLNDVLTELSIEQGYQYPEYEAYRDPYATTVVRKEKRKLLRAELERGIWHDLHLLTNVRESKSGSGPLNLRAYNQSCEGEESAALWVGELVKADDAKIVDCIESTFTVPGRFFSQSGQMTYEAGIDFADLMSFELRRSIWNFWKTLIESPKADSKLSKQKYKDRVSVQEMALRHYWHRLDQNHQILIQLAGDPDYFRGGVPAIGTEGAKDSWTECVREAARSAYESSCPRSTPRQIQAYANGIKPLLRSLYPKEEKTSAKTAPKTEKVSA